MAEHAQWEELASDAALAAATQALEGRGVKTVVVENRNQALETLKTMIPAGAEVMTASSTTLQQIGFVDLLISGQHPWNNLKDQLLAEEDPERQAELRRRSVTAEYFLGSVHAVAQTGEVVTASASGSQIPPYAFSSPNVIWVVGTHKIVADVDEAFRRINQHSVPLEDARMKAEGYPGTTVGKILINHREIMPDRSVTLILVKEKLGF